MTTPKERAELLVKRFHPMTYTAVHAQDTTGEYADAIRCALIAVDEIINSIVITDLTTSENQFNYWEEVKSEIEKL
jgi:hypothetical protein